MPTDSAEPAESGSASPLLDSTRRTLHLVAAFLAVAGLEALLQSRSVGFSDPDGYYHIRWSQILGEGLAHGRLPDFVWLPLTLLNENTYADHHFLFHVLQIPFTWQGNLVLGAKASAVVIGTLGYVAFYGLIVWRRVRLPFAWLVLLIGSSSITLLRSTYPRAPAAMVVILAAAVWLLFSRRYMWLGVLSFVAVWTYSLFPLIGVFAVVWTAVLWLEDRRLVWQPVAFVAAGTAAGLVINPYFPRNILLFADHLSMVGPGAEMATLGREWEPTSLAHLVTYDVVALVAQIAAVAIALRTWRRTDANVRFLGVVSTFLFVLALRSVRFTEYWSLFAVLFLAFTLAPALEHWASTRLAAPSRRIASAAVAYLAAIALAAFPVGLAFADDTSKARGQHPEVYVAATEWLRTHTPEGSRVYNVSWEDFPPLFFYDTHNTYVSGLAATYLSYANPELERQYEAIYRGDVHHPGAAIRDRFGARYIFVSTTSHKFLESIKGDPTIQPGYVGPYSLVLVISDAQASAPAGS